MVESLSGSELCYTPFEIDIPVGNDVPPVSSLATASNTDASGNIPLESGLYLRFRTQPLAGEAKESNETLVKDR
jgi:hypothetical protein